MANGAQPVLQRPKGRPPLAHPVFNLVRFALSRWARRIARAETWSDVMQLRRNKFAATGNRRTDSSSTFCALHDGEIDVRSAGRSCGTSSKVTLSVMASQIKDAPVPARPP